MQRTGYRRQPRRLLAVLVATAVCVVGLGTLVDPARALSAVTPDAGPAGRVVYGHHAGIATHAITSLVTAQLNGRTEYLLGTDLVRPVQYGIDYDEGEWAGAWPGGTDVERATRVLSHADWAEHRDPQEIAALQAAVWHYSDHFDLDRADHRNPATVITRYDELVADADAHPGTVGPRAALAVAPSTQAVTGAAPAFVSVTGDASTPWSIEVDDERSSVHPASADATTCDITRSIDTLIAPATVCVITTGARPDDPIDGGIVVRSSSRWVDTGRIFTHDGRRSLVMANRNAEQSEAVATITSR